MYTWGAGHGKVSAAAEDTPSLVTALSSERIIKVACGAYYNYILCITSQGKLYSIGDSESKLLSGASTTPSKTTNNNCMLLEHLQNVSVVDVCCGSQMNLALSDDGKVYTWTKIDGWKLVDSCLKNKRITSISMSMHALVLTDDGELYGWGKNENKQICDNYENGNEKYVQQPRLIEMLPDAREIVGICCGATQSFAWTDTISKTMQVSMPFIIDLSENTFK